MSGQVHRRRSRVLVLAALCLAGPSCGDKNPADPTPVCSITISPASLTFGSGGGTGAVTVTIPAGCAWSVTGSAAWITITAGASGNGPGSIAYQVPDNPGTSPRDATLTIGGQTHTVTQQGRPPTICTYAIAPERGIFAKDAATGSFTVTAPADCTWSAVSNASWVVVSSGSPGSGNGTVSYAVAANPDPGDRVGGIAVANRAFRVDQAGDTSACAYAVAPVLFTPCMPGGGLTATVTTSGNCPWTATSNASWIAITGGTSGSGSGNITMTFPDNYDAPREGIVGVRWPTPTEGQNIRIAQAGCLYAVSRGDFGFTAAGGSGTFTVTQQSVPNTCGSATQDRCVWSAASDVPWITVTSSMPRSGDDPVAFTVAPNAGAPSRVGRITVRDKVVVITQAGQ